MKEVHNINVIKNIGQWGICPILGLFLAVKAIQAGRVTGYFAFMFGALIFLAMWGVLLVIYHILIVSKVQASNDRIEKERRDALLKMIEEENDPDEYPEYDD